MSISTRELAGLLGITPQRVNELGRKGKIHREPDGQWNPEKVLFALKRNLDMHQVRPSLGERRVERTIQNATPRIIARPMAEESGDMDSSKPSMADAQLAHEIAKAKKAAIEVRRLEGKSVDAEDVAREVGGMIKAARNRALLMSAKLAPKVAAISDVVKCQEVIDREIRFFLTELREYRPDA